MMIGETFVPSADEMRLVRVGRALASGDWQAAEEAAQWLLRNTGAGVFLDALAPAASTAYGNAFSRRKKAATA